MSKIKLSDVEWEVFRITDIFSVKNNKPYHKATLKLSQDGFPYVTRTSLNNATEAFICLMGDEDVVYGNTISLGAENADFFYQPFDYLSGNKMYSVSNKHMNRYIGLFLVQCFRSSIYGAGFGYGKGLTGTRFKNRKIVLPVELNGSPNWQFMEDYVKQELRIQAQKIVRYYEDKKHEVSFNLVGLDEVGWETFSFTDIFREIKRGKRLKKADHMDGDIPYVSSTALNNGVDGFIGNIEGVRSYENNLSLANSGSVGSCFYHAYKYVASDHVTGLTLENPNKYVYLFMSTVINRLSEKYSFSREINDSRIRREKIMLPVNSDGNPHWDYMSKLTQNVEIQKISKIISYFNNYLN